MYPNLAAEMARKGITQQDIADALSKNPATVSGWFNNRGGGFSVDDAFLIKERFFDECDVDYLFSEVAR